jgi:hypothetical protein
MLETKSMLVICLAFARVLAPKLVIMFGRNLVMKAITICLMTLVFLHVIHIGSIQRLCSADFKYNFMQICIKVQCIIRYYP